MRAFSKIDMPIVLPLHPRMRNTLGTGLKSLPHQVRLIDPVPYLDMLMLEKHARIILTDSGGVQKESYWLDTPCVTLRDETEWVELVHCGCNRLTGVNPQAILQAVRDFEASGASLPADRPTNLYGEGHAAEKIIEHLVALTGTSTA